eukprot:TRINITY_DN1662_c0_g2_i2.p1 TRINITY_DN1662_c0_g2~~TRINITY_DN1662_c0_g2_i2.p1  ORF type:complete len:236 (+),score=30.73 TRINITY_DN1662_c0_g2_i2:137-844(+)
MNLWKGRLVGIAVLPDENKRIPIVRTTTIFNQPPAIFPPLYLALIDEINRNLQFRYFPNNCMVERYTQYRTMKYHSDQALDLIDSSFICLFSCYNNPNTTKFRVLRVCNKVTKKESDVVLFHNSCVMFSTRTNSQFVHKIILPNTVQNTDDSEWLGITMRCSKTYISHDSDGTPRFFNGEILKLATVEERQVFYTHKANENKMCDNNVTQVNYTISPSDLMNVASLNFFETKINS